MSLTLSKIIEEADIRVANAFDDSQKVDWLNEINNEFFDVVKIPKAASFTTTSGTSLYTLSAEIRGKNIDKVHVGKTIFPSFLYSDVQPGQNYHVFDDDTARITLTPTPTQTVTGIVRYHKIATTPFVLATLTAVPDAPAEYHWIYILGLCERIAKAMDDTIKGNNYGNDYRGNLAIAQQNYQR